MNNLTMGSLFDGIGGFVFAGNQVGINTLWSSEIDPCCEAVTKHHFPNVVQLGDITKIDGAKVPLVDIICGGSPCQDLSVAGKRAGLAGERSGLYMEQIRIIREMRAATNNTYPRYMVWENVPGALSSNKGEDFRAVLEEAARCADKTVSIPESKKWSNAGCIVGDGWSIAWRILDAQFWGVPQRRRRIFLVADFGSERAGEVLFKQEGLRGYSAEGREAREGIATDVEGSVDGSVYNESGQGYWMPDFGCLRAEGENRPTRPGHCVVQEVRCLNQHDTQSQRIYDASGIYPSLSANENGGQNRQAIVYQASSGDVAGTLDASYYKGAGERNGIEREYIVQSTICLQANGIDRKEENGCNGKGLANDVSYTLNTIDRHAVAYGVNCRNAVIDEEKTHTLQAHSADGTSLNCTPSVCYASTGYGKFIEGRPTLGASGGDCGGGSEALIMATGQANAEIAQGISTTLLAESHEQPICVHPRVCGTIAASGAGTNRPAGQGNETDLCVVTKAQKGRKYIIRRLSPLECERLQGFPDNWCTVEYKNKPMSDSARYRMCGNSVAIPCVVRILGGIAGCHIQNTELQKCGRNNKIIAVDCYNQSISEMAMTLGASACDYDHVPCVIYDANHENV